MNILVLTLADSTCQCVSIPCCGTYAYLFRSLVICRRGRCEITVTSWYLENTRGRGCGCSLYNFLSFSRHINMPITTSQPCSSVMAFQNRYNQTCGMKSVRICSLINYQKGRNLFHTFISRCIHCIVVENQCSMQAEKVHKSAIESTALIMQICFI